MFYRCLLQDVMGCVQMYSIIVLTALYCVGKSSLYSCDSNYRAKSGGKTRAQITQTDWTNLEKIHSDEMIICM